MAKRGVSAEEKLRRLVNFFTSKPDVYNIKELESKIPKACEVSSMIVPDLVKEAVDENLIRSDKLGNARVYWLFEKEAEHFYTCEIEKLEMAIQGYGEEIAKKEAHLARLEKMVEKSEGRDELMAVYDELRQRAEAAERNRWLSENCSYAQYEQMGQESSAAKATINKATDDIFTLKAYVCGKFGLDKKDFDRSFDLKESMDYVE
ncbi:hypothetical protein PAPHI01_0936 [Pancytospora philotis]|nr:hypothetical protein PAPHI01_0936 [Pancytospora philotis]